MLVKHFLKLLARGDSRCIDCGAGELDFLVRRFRQVEYLGTVRQFEAYVPSV